MIDAALQPFQFPFMQNAFLIALIVAPPTALLSCFLVLKGWALMGDAVSHAVLPGIVLAYMAGIPLLIGAFIAGLGSALLTGWLADPAISGVHGSVLTQALASVAVMFYSMVATALVLLVTSRITDLRVSSDDEQTGLDMALHAERLGH